MKLRTLLLIFLILVIAAVSGAAGFIYKDLNAPVSHSHAGSYIDIERGSSPAEIVERLYTTGVIRRKEPLLLYLRAYKSSIKLKAGSYRFASPISPLEVVRKLQQGEEKLNRFTLIEGWSRWEIAAALAANQRFHISEPDAFKLLDNANEIHELDPDAQNLEGYLFPDTYLYPDGTTAPEMVSLMTHHFRQQWKPEWYDKAKALKRSPKEIITIASLIETEAKLDEDRPLIASVIYNRLDRNIPLGVDSSIIYASKLAGKWKNDGKVYKSDLERRTPYNTRILAGLPPTPIASPGLSSLNAALAPAQTNYLFYVREPARNDGKHNFYETSAEFEKGVKALRDWEKLHAGER